MVGRAVFFGEVRVFEGARSRLDMPVLASIDPAAALVALFRLRLGVLSVLGGAAAIGVLLDLAGLT